MDEAKKTKEGARRVAVRSTAARSIAARSAAARSACHSAWRSHRGMGWIFVLVLLFSIALPLVGYVMGDGPTPQAALVRETNPRANYWRAVREGLTGYTAVTGQETNVLINNAGQNWRQLRNGLIVNYGGWFLAFALLAIGVFYTLRGQIKLTHGRLGQTIPRWSLPERVMHWSVASLFIILAVTGLSLLFGRAVLIPVMGPAGFATWAEVAKNLHNYLGPVFAIGVLLIILSWIRFNLPSKVDWPWFKQGGGIIGSAHPSAGRANAGEKVWFWLICSVGVAVIISGFVLDFPNFGQNRESMAIANLIHSALAILWIGVFFGHVYIGTLGTEGAFEGMTRGRVDVNWARQHHDLWYEEELNKGVTLKPARPQPLQGAAHHRKHHRGCMERGLE
jgi:formate dehydrogenase, gamma subunit